MNASRSLRVLVPVAAALAVVPLSSCGKGGGGSAEQEPARPVITVMQFRGVPEGDPLLGPRYTHPEGGYSLRPPAPWARARVPAPAGAKKALYRSHFADPGGKGMLDASIVTGGPASLDPDTMNSLRNSMGEPLAKAAGGTLVGTDLFRFGDFTVLQVMTRKDDHVHLNLLFFRKPGSFAEVTFSAPVSSYQGLARAIEASIASFRWEGR